MALEWSEDLAVGVRTIDEQHRELIRRINGLLEAMRAGQGHAEVSRTVQFLGGYVVLHFGLEEKYMLTHGYPGQPQHKTQHEAFVREFNGIRAKLDGAPTSATVLHVQRRLCDWLVNHIRNTDKALGAYLARAA